MCCMQNWVNKQGYSRMMANKYLEDEHFLSSYDQIHHVHRIKERWRMGFPIYVMAGYTHEADQRFIKDSYTSTHASWVRVLGELKLVFKNECSRNENVEIDELKKHWKIGYELSAFVVARIIWNDLIHVQWQPESAPIEGVIGCR